MPNIFDNIEEKLAPSLKSTLSESTRADFSVGYFNLRGWRIIDSNIDHFAGEDDCCRLLVGMGYSLDHELKASLSVLKQAAPDQSQLKEIQLDVATRFRQQLIMGLPTEVDEAGLRKLVHQLRGGKLKVKLFLRHSLHAKLYLCYREDKVTPKVGYLGSSNLTKPGLSAQGELNIDVTDNLATKELEDWFEARWNDRCSIDITLDLIDVINESWAREVAPPPYHIYLKIAYHLSHEARAGLASFAIPKAMQGQMLPFQEQAVLIAARHLSARGGVLLADVVGLGKTMMATALAKVFDDDYGYETLILCPKNLVKMWEEYRIEHKLNARVISLSVARRELPDLPRFRIVLIDESHNLRNSDSKTHKAVREYIELNDSKCILLTATPYNKTFLDLGNQLGLFLDGEKSLPIKPERLLKTIGPQEFSRKHQCQPNTLKAFKISEHAEDWQEIMRLYMVRRTRSFIKANYAKKDEANGRYYLTFPDESRFYLPDRVPKTVHFDVNDEDPNDQYAQMYSDNVVDAINALHLPRYGLGNYCDEKPDPKPTKAEEEQLENLTKAGQRLIGFCRTNLFKRLESSGHAFILSLRNHLLRNYIFLYAIDNNLELPIGTLDIAAHDTRLSDEDVDSGLAYLDLFESDQDGGGELPTETESQSSESQLREQAAQQYQDLSTLKHSRYRWLRSNLLNEKLKNSLEEDCQTLIGMVEEFGSWDPEKDSKLSALIDLLAKHPKSKLLVFTQFADTVRYLYEQLVSRGVSAIGCVTGSHNDPTTMAWRFSPISNKRRERISSEEELRILITTDVLSEGQNLQDCAIVVNYDIPWAIIRLIQRIGRVDRIGQQADEIFCYTYMPSDGVERIIKLRQKVQNRLRDNAEVVGTDEVYGFEDKVSDQKLRDLYTEKANTLDDEDDDDVDLTSKAYQIWKNAIDQDPELEKVISTIPDVVFSTKAHTTSTQAPTGVLVYLRTAEGHDALAWLDEHGKSVTESWSAILKAAECNKDTPALERFNNHHELVAKGAELIARESRLVGGQLGNPRGARFRIYERMQGYLHKHKGTLFEESLNDLRDAVQEIHDYPLRSHAVDVFNRQLKIKINDHQLAELVTLLHKEGKLCAVPSDKPTGEPQIICSLGLKQEGK